MATIEQALYQILTDDAGVAAIISSRVFPVFIPQGATLPAVTYTQIKGNRIHTIPEPDDMVRSSFKISCWATTYSAAESLSSAVADALDNYTGTVGNVVIQAAHFDTDLDVVAQRAGADQLLRHGKDMNFNIWFNE